MTDICVTTMNIYGATLEGENPLPFFRDRKHDRDINYIEPFPENKKNKFGEETGFRILPYRFQDRYGRKRMPLNFKKIVMENNNLEASFLPEMGGRLISLVDKRTGRELLSRNPVFQPANLAIRNAWFAGGIEWNIGQIGHAHHTCSPLFAAIVTGNNGEQFLRLYEFERCKRLFWQIDFYLPDDSQVLYAYTRVINPNKFETPMYWWTNIAVPETPDTRVFASAEDVIYNDPGIVSRDKGFGYAKMPIIPTLPEKDFSYPYNSHFSNEYFFQCYPQKIQWEAVAYKEGDLFFEASTERLKYRKMFCWGSHGGGQHWQEFLAEPGVAYLEIQAGLAPTQLHGIDMPAASVWDWTQVFGGSCIEPQDVHDKDWFKAKSFVQGKIHNIVSEHEIYDKEKSFKSNADITPQNIIHMGSGWGALEFQRMRSEKENNISAGFSFPLSTIGEEQYPWLSLLENGKMQEKDIGQLPGAWMVQKEWKSILFSSLKRDDNRNWYALLHAGVMEFEDGHEEEAQILWKESIEKQESAWAYRNMAVAKKMIGDIPQAVSYMQKAVQMPGALSDHAIAEEYMTLLMNTKKHAEVWETFKMLPFSIQTTERIRLIAGNSAIELGNYDFVEELFEHDYACIREGELLLTDLWFKYYAIKLADERGVKIDSGLLDYVKENIQPPARLDFRLINK